MIPPRSLGIEHRLPSPPQVKRRVALSLWLFLLAIYALTASGQVTGVDGWRRLGVTSSVVEARDVVVAPGFGDESIAASGSTPSYVSSAIGQSVAFLPFYLAGKGMARLLPKLDQRAVLSFAASWLNPIVGSLLGVALFLLVCELGYSMVVSVAVAVGFGLGTMAWQQSKDAFEHPLEALFLVAGAWCVVRWSSGASGRWLVAGGTALALALLTRLNSGVALPLFFAYILIRGLGGGRPFSGKGMLLVLAWIQLGLPVLAGLGLSLAYNYLRFGGLLHSPTPADEAPVASILALIGNPDWPGRAAGLLVSPFKGLFWYNPLLLVLPTVLPAFWRRHRSELILVVGIPVAYLAFYADVSVAGWTGDWCWGPRYIFAALPFLVVPFAELAAPALSTRSHLKSGLLALLLALSFAIQLSSVLVSHRKWLYKLTLYGQYDDVVWTLDTSPLLRQWETLGENLGNVVNGTPLLFGFASSSGDLLARSAQLNALDLWWWKLTYVGVPVPLALLPACVLVFAAAMAARSLVPLLAAERLHTGPRSTGTTVGRFGALDR